MRAQAASGRVAMAVLLAAPERSRAHAPPWRVVLVDDTEDLRFILRRLLHAAGSFKVEAEADNGAAAIDVARRVQPDLLLLDLLMPVMDGWQALPEIRRASPETKIVVVSGQDKRVMESRALSLGASAYIEKGMASSDIIATLRRVMAG